MKLSTVLEVIDGKAISKNLNLDLEAQTGGGADLMSDVLTFGQEGMLLMTGLINSQVVRTAEVAGIRAIVFVRGKIPPQETIALAEEKGIPLLATKYTLYEACGRLYKAGLPGSGLFELTLKRLYEAFDNRK